MARIVWTEPAVQDLDAIADYIALDKPEAARRLVRQVMAAVARLRRFAQLGSVPLELRGLPYRQLVIPPCRGFYRADRKVGYVIHVLRGEQLVRREIFPG